MTEDLERADDDRPGEPGRRGDERGEPAASPASDHSEPAAGRGTPGAGAGEPGATVDTVDAEIGELVGRLSGDEEMDRETRGRLLGRLTRLLGTSARRAGASGMARGRWLAEVFAAAVPHIPVRDLDTLRRHHHGLEGEALADSVVRVASNTTTAVGAAGGALAAVEFAAPPMLLSAPAQLAAETLVVAAVEVKMLAELHEVYGVRVQGSGTARAAAFVTSWTKQRGINPAEAGSFTAALGAAAKAALRKRLLRVFGRHLTTLGPLLTGAAAGAALNRTATKRLADTVRKDLRRHLGGPASHPAIPAEPPSD